MDASHVSALAGLAGAVIGGFTSFWTNWITQQAQLREQRRERARKERERLFVEFLNEASRLYGDALGHEKDDVDDLVKLYAIAAHLRMVSSQEVVAAAERVIDLIVDSYRGPNRTLHELREFAANDGLFPFRELGRVFRKELEGFGAGSGSAASAMLPTMAGGSG